MRVQFVCNVGTIDAAELGLVATECKAGAVVEMEPEQAEKLAARGLIKRPDDEGAAPASEPGAGEPGGESGESEHHGRRRRG